MTHEFLILAETGESAVFLDRDLADLSLGERVIDWEDGPALQEVVDRYTASYARTDETHEEAVFEAEIPEERRLTARGIEVGHIFYFGTKYSRPLNATVNTPDGEVVPFESGSYGIGVSRLAGAIIEASHDDRGIIWPEAVAPFEVAVINLRQGDAEADGACDDLYAKLIARGLDVLYDDRDERAGAKFATIDLIGIPWKLVVGPRGLKEGVVELVNRRTGETENLSPDDAMNRLAATYGRA
jgi:prolyl-tRNA synthetase